MNLFPEIPAGRERDAIPPFAAREQVVPGPAAIQAPAAPTLLPPWTDAAGWAHPRYYSTIRVADIDGDHRPELVVRTFFGVEVWAFDDAAGQWRSLGPGPALSDDGGWGQPPYYTTLQCADVDGDGRAELLVRSSLGIIAWNYDPATRKWNALPAGPALSDVAGWAQPQYFTTIQCADIDGDGQAELIARSSIGIQAWKFHADVRTWDALPLGPALADSSGWGQPQYYTTIQLADIDGDGRAELLARSAYAIVVYRCDPLTYRWTEVPNGPALADSAGWGQPYYYSTIQCADIDGDHRCELIARSSIGIEAWKFDPKDGRWRGLPNGPALTDASGWTQVQYYSTIACADVDGDGRAELLARSAAGMCTWAYDRARSVWQQLGGPGPFTDVGGWSTPQINGDLTQDDVTRWAIRCHAVEQYYSTIRFGDFNGDGKAEMVGRGAAGVYTYALDASRNDRWSPFPGLGPIPSPTPENVKKVQDSLLHMDAFVGRYHDFFQDDILILYELLQVSTDDPGQALANLVISTSFGAIGEAPIPGAGTIASVLGAIFNYVSTYDPDRNLHGTFASVLQRFATNARDLADQIARYRSHTADSWTTPLTDPATGQSVVLADLANASFPAPATEPFQKALNLTLARAKYDLWKSVLPLRWNDVTVLNPPDLTFKTEGACREWIERYVETNPNYYVTYAEADATWPAKGRVWRVKDRWLGYGFFPFGHHEAPRELCNELFQDDGLGQIIRPNAITTRLDVFTSWNLPVQRVSLPSYGGPAAGKLRQALAIAEAQHGPLDLAAQDLTGAVLQGANLTRANLARASLQQAQLARADLREANLQHANLEEADLQGADLAGARLDGATLREAKLDFANCSKASLRGASLHAAQALALRAPEADLSGATLERAVLRGAVLRGADLHGCNLAGVDLAAADLRGANLSGARLEGASLRGADLTGADVQAADLVNVETIFAEGLEQPSPETAARPVRCLAAGRGGIFDPFRFARVSDLLADLVGAPLASGYGALVEGNGSAIAAFAQFAVPLRAPLPDRESLRLTFGMGGAPFYQQAAELMKTMGVDPARAAVLPALGLTSGYPPLGYQARIVSGATDIHAAIQGPIGLGEARALLVQAGVGAAAPALQTAASALGATSLMLLTLDFSPQHPWLSQGFFAIPAGNAAAAANLITALGVDWSTLGVIDQWLARTTAPYLLSVGILEGTTGYEIGVYLPYNAERDLEVDSLLDDASRARFTALEELTTRWPLTVSYVGLLRAPSAQQSVVAYVAYD